jgi:hypothetical protein
VGRFGEHGDGLHGIAAEVAEEVGVDAQGIGAFKDVAPDGFEGGFGGGGGGGVRGR